ncbi:MAG: hypothetical protein RR459_03205 [Christensenellaceae bacterium]
MMDAIFILKNKNMETKGVDFKIGGKLEYCGVEILPNQKDIECIMIESIVYHKTLKVQGSMKENMWVAHFTKNSYTELPMLLNSTNRKRIFKLYGNTLPKGEERQINLLHNIIVRLTKETTRDPQDGGDCDGLRISKTPALKPKLDVLTSSHVNWDKCVTYVSKGGNIDDLRSKYKISIDVENEIKNHK